MGALRGPHEIAIIRQALIMIEPRTCGRPPANVAMPNGRASARAFHGSRLRGALPRIVALNKVPAMFEARFQSFEDATQGSAITGRLDALRAELARRGLDGFLVPRADRHQNEYVPP